MLTHCSDSWAISSAMPQEARCIYDSPHKRFMDVLLTKSSLGMNHKLVHKATKTVALETKTLNVSCPCNSEIRNPTSLSTGWMSPINVFTKAFFFSVSVHPYNGCYLEVKLAQLLMSSYTYSM